MRRLVLTLFMLFGLSTFLSAKQNVLLWQAKNEEEVENVLSYCKMEVSLLIYLGCQVVSVSVTDGGYLIVYEDFE